MYEKIKGLILNGMASNTIKKMYLTVVIFVVGIVVISSGVLYFTFKNLGISIISSNDQQNIEQLSKAVETVSATGHNLALEIYQDRDVQPLLFGYNPKGNEISRGLNRLDRYKQSTPFVHSIYTYNRGRDEFYTTLPSEGIKSEAEFFDQEIVKIMNNEVTHDLRYPIIRDIENRTRVGNNYARQTVYTFIMYSNYSGEVKAMDNVTIVNIAEDWVKELITGNNVNKQDAVFIINQNGKLVSDMKRKASFASLGYDKQIDKIIENEASCDSFAQKIEDTPMLISYANIENLPNWTMVKMSDYTEVMAPLQSVKNMTLWVLGIAIIITSLLALVVSKSLYKPVKRLEGYVTRLNKEKRLGFYEMKQSFLLSFVKGHKIYSQQELDDRFEQYKICLDTNVESKVMVLKIDHYDDFTQKNTKDNQELLQYSIVNISEEIGNNLFASSVVDLSDGFFASIINIDLKWPQSEFDEYIKDYINDVQKTIKNLLDITVSVVIGDVAEDFSMVSEIYKEARQAMRYSKFHHEQSIIEIQDIYQIEKKQYIYSEKEYNILFENLKQGKIQEAIKTYDKIISEVTEVSYGSYESTVLHLAYSVNLTVGALSDQVISEIDHNPSKFIENILNAEYSVEINTLFMAVFKKIGSFIQEVNESKKADDNNELIQSIYEIMDKEYADINIGIQSIAEQVNMSAPYLGRLFTEHTGQTITQYINDKRLEKASELLIGTDEIIASISDTCGFSNVTYFYKRFKQMHHMTPSQYRAKHKS